MGTLRVSRERPSLSTVLVTAENSQPNSSKRKVQRLWDWWEAGAESTIQRDSKTSMQQLTTTIKTRNHGMDFRIALKWPMEKTQWTSATRNAMSCCHAPLREASPNIIAINWNARSWARVPMGQWPSKDRRSSIRRTSQLFRITSPTLVVWLCPTSSGWRTPNTLRWDWWPEDGRPTTRTKWRACSRSTTSNTMLKSTLTRFWLRRTWCTVLSRRWCQLLSRNASTMLKRTRLAWEMQDLQEVFKDWQTNTSLWKLSNDEKLLKSKKHLKLN